MGRYRPPAPKSSPYITRDGYMALQDELKNLWTRRRDVTKALAAAAAEGDRSENAEYIYRKKELAGIDRRIRYLQKRLPVLKVVSEPPTDRNRVFFGATVTLEDDNGDTVIYRIVGADELGSEKGWISMDAPLARAILKKAVSDKVEVLLPDGRRNYRIIAVAYENRT
jgi:transcription elongation factor GreB